MAPRGVALAATGTSLVACTQPRDRPLNLCGQLSTQFRGHLLQLFGLGAEVAEDLELSGLVVLARWLVSDAARHGDGL